MRIQRRLKLLVGLGIALILAVTGLSVWYVTAAFSRSARDIGRFNNQANQMSIVERDIDAMVHAVNQTVLTGDRSYAQTYEKAAAGVQQKVQEISGPTSGKTEKLILEGLTEDLARLKTKSQRIFALSDPSGSQRTLAANLLFELDALHAWIERDIEKYQQVNATHMSSVLEQLHGNNMTINLVFLAVLLTAIGFLFAFVVYFHRKVSVPLQDLWEGTEEISHGNLDYRMQVHDQGDIARLGDRFNEMAQKLKSSYAELEQKLYERTHELASLDAVALTLSQAGSLKDLLEKSLMRILDSLSGIKPKGGVFLCEPGGEVLRLMTHKGLPDEFARNEGVIKMGECLCGIVAQTGELLFTEHGCGDNRHTRHSGNESHSHIIIPIKSRGIVLGVIFLYPQTDFKLKPSDVRMLHAIGTQLGMAVENFRFYAEVKESSEKYWDLFENARDIFFIMDAAGNLTAVNRAAEIFSGYSKVELVGKSIFDFLTPAGAENARTMLSGGKNAGRQWTEFEIVKRDATRAFIEVTARRLYRNRQPAGYQVSARDVTEQKHLREMLVQAERLGAIGQVGVAVRHEINNPLTTLIGNTELLIERYDGKDRELMTRLETILNNSLRIAEIVKKLQDIRKDKVVEYLKGVKMTDLKN